MIALAWGSFGLGLLAGALLGALAGVIAMGLAATASSADRLDDWPWLDWPCDLEEIFGEPVKDASTTEGPESWSSHR